jgi:hypothetical protein
MTDVSYESASSDGTSSGGNSPRSLESGFEQQLHQVTQQVPRVPPRRSSRVTGSACDCHRAPVYAYDRCAYCLRENGWA